MSITDLTNRPTIAPSMEAVEELKVQTKTYEADMGHAAGGVFNTTARSGSNSWHGSGLLVSKPRATTGTLYFAKKAGLKNPPQYYYWAGSVGGPIIKDRTFFWFSTDDYKQTGQKLGPYEGLAKLGEGGLGLVLPRCRHNARPRGRAEDSSGIGNRGF